MKWFETIFTKSKLMTVSGVLSVLCFLALIVIDIVIDWLLFGIFCELLLVVMIVALLYCYKKGETSCQKALVPSILMCMMLCYWLEVSGLFDVSDFQFTKILKITMAIASSIIFFNHIMMQADHKGAKTTVTVSQIVLFVVIVVALLDFISQFFGAGQYYEVINSFAFLCVIVMITCMETRIQKYKAIRFAAMNAGTWTEEERQEAKKIFKV